MSEHSDKARIDFILEMIERIEFVVKRHGDIVAALEDTEGELALYMAISQIGEALQKLSDDIVKSLGLEKERQYAYATRNYIVHDYDGVDKYILEDVIGTHLPILKKILEQSR